MKIQLTGTRIINWIALLMILVTIVLLFQPNWTYETKEKVDGKRVEVTKVISINDYVWFPKEHKDMTKVFQDMYEELYGDKDYFWINDMVTMPVLFLALGVVLGILSLWHQMAPMASGLALFLGGYGAYSFLVRPEWKIGAMYMPILIMCFVTAAVGLAGVVWYTVVWTKKKKAAKAAA